MDQQDPPSKDPSGITLSELPDAPSANPVKESSTAKLNARKAEAKFQKKQADDPRIAGLAKLTNEEKVLAMTRLYEFDRKEPRFDKLVLCLIPVAIKYGQLFPFMQKTLLGNASDFNIVGTILADSISTFASIFRFAELISAGLIFFFPPLQTTRYHFVVGFEGVDVPLRLRVKNMEENNRTKIRWEQIGRVVYVEGPVPGLDLENYSRQSLGQMRWDLRRSDKETLLKLLRRYVGDKHPLRVYVERELGNEE
jgi:hypothetical protein